MLLVGDLIERVRAYQPGADFELIRRAYDSSLKATSGRMAKSGAR